MLKKLPLRNPAPNATEYIDIVMGRKPQSRVPLIEYSVDEGVKKSVVTGLLGREWVDDLSTRAGLNAYWDNCLAFWRHLGYECIKFEFGVPFTVYPHRPVGDDPTPGAVRQRTWADEHHGIIRTWEDFEKYPWPSISGADFYSLEYVSGHLPEGMGLLASHCGGIFEILSQSLMSLEGLCLAVCENPDLVQAITDKIGGLMVKFYEHLLELDGVAALFPGDDMGFVTGPLIGPDDLRKYALPWHKRFAAMAHKRGIPYFLHSCGNLQTIMRDLIDDVEIDAKHSHEDVIMPVDEFQACYGVPRNGHRAIGVLGGVDVNILSLGTPDDVRRRVRELIEICGPRGRYAMGSGNSIPNYVPAENYLAMVDETLAMND